MSICNISTIMVFKAVADPMVSCVSGVGPLLFVGDFWLFVYLVQNCQGPFFSGPSLEPLSNFCTLAKHTTCIYVVHLNFRRTIYNKLVSLYPTHACKEFNDAFQSLKEKCGYGPNSIPQLEDISNFMRGTNIQLNNI